MQTGAVVHEQSRGPCLAHEADVASSAWPLKQAPHDGIAEALLLPPGQIAGHAVCCPRRVVTPSLIETDGRQQTEQSPNGRQVRTTATLSGERLTVSTEGDRAVDYQVTFEPIDNGRSLRVTRRITDEDLRQGSWRRASMTRHRIRPNSTSGQLPCSWRFTRQCPRTGRNPTGGRSEREPEHEAIPRRRSVHPNRTLAVTVRGGDHRRSPRRGRPLRPSLGPGRDVVRIRHHPST